MRAAPAAGETVERMAPLIDVADLAAGGAIVILAPHPIDELIGCGGLIAEAAERGIGFHVVMLTGGDMLAVPRATALCDIRHIGVLRRAETLTAISRLGGSPTMVTFLDLPEGALAADGFAFGIAVDVVAAVLRQHGAGTLLAPEDGDPHPDHAAAAHIARAASRAVAMPPQRFAYAASGQRPPGGPAVPRRGIAVDVGAHTARRHWALEAYRQAHGTMAQRGYAVHHPAELRRLVGRPIECFFTPEV